MAYSKAKLKINGGKASPCLKTLATVPFKEIMEIAIYHVAIIAIYHVQNVCYEPSLLLLQ
jgi:hypothetical protein